MEAYEYQLHDLRTLVKSGKVPVNSVLVCNNEEKSILQLAVETSDAELIDFLLSRSVNLDLNLKSLGTALHVAVNKKDINVVKKLVHSGADVNVVSQGNERLTPLHLAVKVRSYDIVEFLIMSGADVNAVRNESEQRMSCYNWSTLALAIFSMDARIVELLLKNNATIEHGSEEVYSSMRLAIRTNNIKILQLLEDFGAEVNMVKNGEYTRDFSLAVEEDNLEVFKFFIKKCSDLNTVVDDFLGDTLVHKAVKSCSTEILHYLLNCNADINIVNKGNLTALNLVINMQSETVYYPSDNYVKIVNIIEQHIIKLYAANQYINDINLKLISDKNFCEFHGECKEEINLLLESKIDKTNISFYNVLNKSIHKLAVNLRHVDYCFDEQVLTLRFPLYGEMIFENLKKGMERRKLLNNSEELYTIFIDDLPSLIVGEIFNYLSNEDLRILDC